PPERLHQAARAELTRLLGSPSPRIRRLAAAALARTGDAAALDGLSRDLATEQSALAQIQIAYALARAGRAEGREHLLEGVSHKRRDVRIDAAGALVELG